MYLYLVDRHRFVMSASYKLVKENFPKSSIVRVVAEVLLPTTIEVPFTDSPPKKSKRTVKVVSGTGIFEPGSMISIFNNDDEILTYKTIVNRINATFKIGRNRIMEKQGVLSELLKSEMVYVESGLYSMHKQNCK